ncbi:hypothetical protein APHAL10511_005771 [Amanita phalloides]|nr:hypothetical protein APHAL10511_005771 [Amanita phalloides]
MYRWMHSQYPNVHCGDPFLLEQTLAAAQEVIQGQSFYDKMINRATILSYMIKSEPLATPTTSHDSSTAYVKKEDMTMMIEKLGQTMMQTFTQTLNNTQYRTPQSWNYGPPATGVNTIALGSAPTRQSSSPQHCNFCSNIMHFISQCPDIDQYMAEGKIAKNAEGQIILPTRNYVPCYNQYNMLKENINEFMQHVDAQSNNHPAMFYSPQPAQESAPPATVTPVMTYKATVEDAEEEEEMERLQRRLVALQMKKRTVLDRVKIPVKSKGNPTKEASTSK